MKYATLLILLLLAACASQEVAVDNHTHSEEEFAMMEHCIQMPQMQGCEYYLEHAEHHENIAEGNSMMGGHMMAPVTSEEQFIVEMIPHHQEAVDTALLTQQTTTNEELQILLEAIVQTQNAEIDMMREWLDQWYAGGYEPQYQPMMGDLEAVTGEERDILFLEGMIMHHKMAVMMAQQVIALEPREEVREFAQDVIAVQTQEIQEMQSLLEGYAPT